MRDNRDTLLHKGRRNLLVQQLRESGRFEERVLKAIGAIPRHRFVEEGLEDVAYKDTPVAIGASQTISQPSTGSEDTGDWDRLRLPECRPLLTRSRGFLH